MTSQMPDASLVRAFRETTLSLIGLYRIYMVDPDLSRATANTLRRLFRRYLRETTCPWTRSRRSTLHALVDELDVLLALTESPATPPKDPARGAR